MSEDAKTRTERPSGPRDHAAPEPLELPERYIAGDEIARGGMGRVVDATDTLLDRKVAVKEALSIDSDALRRFQRETKITARLEHPSIVPVYDAGRTKDGMPFYVMRRVSGQPLDQLIRDAEGLNDRLALLPNLLAATQAIAHAHTRGVLHRDLKPSNILVGDLGETVVIDWGLAKVIDEPADDDPHAMQPVDASASLRTRVGTVFGTPGFMSPEQLEAKEVDARSDVYALGATLYYLLARTPPHSAASEDEMMKAALAGPATPIANVIDGVPPELSAICDKALAYDDDHRYADAAALAADLDRFLRGQLVAAHDYSLRDRIVRFVRMNRVPVAVVVIAVLALGIGAAIAARNILASRDEAQAAARRAEVQRVEAEAARQRETDRANDVTLAQARLLLDTNPSAALALVQPLARSERSWREVRAIAADARTGGLARPLPASDRTLSIALSPDGVHGVSTGNDGVVRTYDLRTRAARVVATVGDEHSVRFLDDAHLVLTNESRELLIIDLATLARRTVQIAASVHRDDAFEGTYYWSDRAGHAWRLPPGSSTPEPLVVADEIDFVAVAPDGAHVALGGKRELWIGDRAGKFYDAATGPIFELAWGTPNHAIIAGRDGVYDVTIDPRRATEVTRSVTELGVAMQNGVVYSAGLNGITVDGIRPAGWDSGKYGGIQKSGSDVVVAGTEGFVAVIAGKRRQDLPSPFGELMYVMASPSSHYMMSVNRWQLYVWNLDELLPRTIDAKIGPSVQLGSVGAHSLVITYPSAPSRWIDLATGVTTPGPVLPFGTRIDSSPSNNLVLFDPFGGGMAYVARPNTTERIEVATELDLAAFIDDDHVFAATPDGALKLFDLATHTSTVIATHATAAKALRVPIKREWIVVGFGDGTLWRMQTATKKIDTVVIATHAWQNKELVATATGDAWFADGPKLRRWRTDGKLEDHVTLPTPIIGLVALDPHRLLAYTRLAQTFLVDLDKPAYAASLIVRDSNFDLSDDAELIAIQRNAGGVTVVDTHANAPWRVARMLTITDTPHITRDGRFVFSRTDDNVSVWPLDLPHSATETGAWVDALADAPTVLKPPK